MTSVLPPLYETWQAVNDRCYDPLRLPRTLLVALLAFNDRSLEQVRQTLTSEQQIILNGALIRKLVDFEVLAAPAPASKRGKSDG